MVDYDVDILIIIILMVMKTIFMIIILHTYSAQTDHHQLNGIAVLKRNRKQEAHGPQFKSIKTYDYIT